MGMALGDIIYCTKHKMHDVLNVADNSIEVHHEKITPAEAIRRSKDRISKENFRQCYVIMGLEEVIADEHAEWVAPNEHAEEVAAGEHNEEDVTDEHVEKIAADENVKEVVAYEHTEEVNTAP